MNGAFRVPETDDKRLPRRSLLTIGAGVAGASLLAACSSSGGGASASPSAGGGGTGASSAATTGSSTAATTTKPAGLPNISWKGTITMYAQSYTPSAPGVQLAPGSAKLQALYTLAKQFQGYYPGITIKFLGSEFLSGANETIVTLAAGSKLPDVWWDQYINVNFDYPKGIATNLYPAFQQPNPYIPGNKRWADVMSPQVVAESLAGPSTIYGVNGDYVAVAWFYNKDLFTKAGISGPPTTWAELITACNKLKAAGITPWALEIPSSGGYDWMVRVFLANALGLDTLKKIDAYSPSQPGITTEDQAIAFQNGILDPTKNQRVTAWWQQAKNLYSFADRTILSLPPKPAPGSPTSSQYFAAGKVAMTFNLSSVPQQTKAAGATFGVGSFPFPSLAGSNQFATSYDSSADAGGPQAALQWFISTPKSDSTLNEAGKSDAVLNWVRFLSTPERVQMITNELGYFPPTFKGSTPPPALAGLTPLIDKPWYQLDGGQFFSAQGTDQIRQLFQQAMLGQTGVSAAQQQYNSVIQSAFSAYIQQNPIQK